MNKRTRILILVVVLLLICVCTILIISQTLYTGGYGGGNIIDLFRRN
jgi:hypothetical protein